MGDRDVTALLTRRFNCFFNGGCRNHLRILWAAIQYVETGNGSQPPNAAATPIPIPANIDLFTGLPPLLLLVTILQCRLCFANKTKAQKSGFQESNRAFRRTLKHSICDEQHDMLKSLGGPGEKN